MTDPRPVSGAHLREMACRPTFGEHGESRASTALLDAADLIERLRAENGRLLDHELVLQGQAGDMAEEIERLRAERDGLLEQQATIRERCREVLKSASGWQTVESHDELDAILAAEILSVLAPSPAKEPEAE